MLYSYRSNIYSLCYVSQVSKSTLARLRNRQTPAETKAAEATSKRLECKVDEMRQKIASYEKLQDPLVIESAENRKEAERMGKIPRAEDYRVQHPQNKHQSFTFEYAAQVRHRRLMAGISHNKNRSSPGKQKLASKGKPRANEKKRNAEAMLEAGADHTIDDLRAV